MSLKIERINYGTKEKLSAFVINFNKNTNSKALRSVVYERLSLNEDVKELSYNGKTYKGFEDLPLEYMKNGDIISLLIDQKMNVDVYTNNSNANKPYRVDCYSMDTSEDLSDRVKERLPYGTPDVVLTSNGKTLSNGVSLSNQGIKNNSRIYSTVKSTGG